MYQNSKIFLPVLLATSGGKRSESWHEKVQSGEGDHVNGQFSEVSVELTGEPKIEKVEIG